MLGLAVATNTIVLIVLIVVLIAVLPTWPYSSRWGYWPGGILGAIILILLLFAILGRL